MQVLDDYIEGYFELINQSKSPARRRVLTFF